MLGGSVGHRRESGGYWGTGRALRGGVRRASWGSGWALEGLEGNWGGLEGYLGVMRAPEGVRR